MITHDPRRARYVVTVGEARRVSTYARGDAASRREAWQFAVEVDELLRERARLEAERALAALEARAEARDAAVAA